ncbi:zinc finger protein, partial [Trichinella spiralis]
IWC